VFCLSINCSRLFHEKPYAKTEGGVNGFGRRTLSRLVVQLNGAASLFAGIKEGERRECESTRVAAS
jgi:hypothetical protein